MIVYYFKIAWRNLLKYKTQSVISILGMAIGFTAFAFTMSWIRYERGYDKHIADGDRIYRVFIKDSTQIGGVRQYSPNVMALYLKENYPEIEAVTALSLHKMDLNLNDKAFLNQCHLIRTDTSFFHVFYPEITINYPEIIEKEYYLFSENSAKKLGLKENQIGERIDSLNINLLDIVPDKPIHSNVPFDAVHIPMVNPQYDMAWGYSSTFTYIRLKKEVNITALEEKLTNISVTKDYMGELIHALKYQCKILPLRKLHTAYPDNEVSIKFHHLKLFAFLALLVICCGFFNYLMLFINRIKIRNRGLALQKVNGASNMQLLMMLFCEFILLLLIALFIGFVFSELLFPYFIKFSLISAPKSFFLSDVILFGLSILLLSLLLAFFPVRYFMKRSIHDNLLPQKRSLGNIKDRFTLMTISLQLIISVLLIFTTSILIYQFNFLNRDYIGFNRFNINTIITHPNEIPIDEIKKVPGVENVIRYGGDFLPRSNSRIISVEGEKENYTVHRFEIFGPEFVDFFGAKIIKGRNVFDGETNVYLINQTADRMLPAEDSSGVKKIHGRIVVGVIEDMYIDSPLVPVFPSVYGILDPQSWESKNNRTIFYAYKYLKESRFSTEEEIRRIGTEDVGNRSVGIYNMEEIFAEYTKSERYLLILLTIMTGVAILIAVFGIYSMITLACNRRRKEIAIRKVNGAKASEIFYHFFKEYFIVAIISSIVAFPMGVFIMQRWLEQYSRRISMEWWIFVGIFILVMLIVLASIYFRVNHAAKENPAEVVKSE